MNDEHDANPLNMRSREFSRIELTLVNCILLRRTVSMRVVSLLDVPCFYFPLYLLDFPEAKLMLSACLSLEPPRTSL